MTDKKVLIKEYILNNPNLSGNEIYQKTKGTPLGIRKQVLYEIVREARKLPEPTLAKKESSIPIKHRTKPQKIKIAERQKAKAKKVKAKAKKVKAKVKTKAKPKTVQLTFDESKFGKIVRKMENQHGLSERKAILRARALLKIPRSDYHKLNQKDVNIILSESP